MAPPPGLTAVCAGYELGKWRCDQLVEYLLNWLPEFALRMKEWKHIAHYNAVESIRKAARIVYTSTKYENRGEIGELLLHALIREVFDSIPAISKYYFKDSPNDTVKGFDAVHVVMAETELELWLGEVKFYTDISKAIAAAVNEIKDHAKADFLKREFIAIGNKIDDTWEHSAALRKLLEPNTSLDKVFHRLCIPVLLTYDSAAVKAHSIESEEFTEQFEQEVLRHWESFSSSDLPAAIRIHLFVFPMNCKKDLLDRFDQELKKCQ